MARNGLEAVKTKEPNDLYDQLSQDGKDQWDALGILGYTPDKGKGGLWFARKTGQKAAEAIGPAEHISVLHSLVKEYVGNQPVIKEVELDSDNNGNTFLPGAAEVVRTVDIPEMRQPSLDFYTYTQEVEDAKAKLKSQRKVLTELVKKHHDILPVDPKTGYRFFRVVDPNNPQANAVQINLIPKGEQIECVLVGEE